MNCVSLRSITAASALALVLSITGAASAQEPGTGSDPAARAATVQRLSEEGSTFYQQRDYRHANEKFQQAYGIDPDPNLLYNIGKCFEALGDKQQAMDKYELFINSPGADSGARVKAQEAVKRLKGETPAGGAGTAAPGGGAAQPAGGRSIVPVVIAYGVGAAGIAVGSIFGATALGKRSDLDAVCSNRQCPPTRKDDITSLKTASTISTIGFIVGAVGVVAGTALLVFGGKATTEKSAGLQVSPYVGVGNAGFTGTF
jgi:hypothetical protein